MSKNVYWVWDKTEFDPYNYYIVATEDIDIIKNKTLDKCPRWFREDKKGKKNLVHIKTKKGSIEQKFLFKTLNINEKNDRIKY